MLVWLRTTFNRLQNRLKRFADAVRDKPEVAFLVRIGMSLGEDDASHMAASIAYYAFLSLFPLLIGVIALLGLFLPSETVQQQVFDFVEQYMPVAFDFIEQNVRIIIEQRGALGIISLAGLFWGASAVFGVIRRVLNRAWNIRTIRPLYIAKPMDLSIALGTGFLVLLSLGAAAFFSLVNESQFPFVTLATDIAGRVFSFLLVLAVFTIIYRYTPNTESPWRYVWPGAVLGAVLFEGAKVAFIFYLNRFAIYNLIYGPIASIVILLVWIYFSAFILIIGAEVSAEYGRTRRNLLP